MKRTKHSTDFNPLNTPSKWYSKRGEYFKTKAKERYKIEEKIVNSNIDRGMAKRHSQVLLACSYKAQWQFSLLTMKRIVELLK